MSGRHRQPGYLACALRLPKFKRLKEALHHASRAPHHPGVAGYVPAPMRLLSPTGPVVGQVDIGTGPVVFAHRVDGLGLAETALVFSQCGGFYMG